MNTVEPTIEIEQEAAPAPTLVQVARPRPERDMPVNREHGRPERVPVYKRDRISFKGMDPNYQYRVVNDVDNRLQTFLEGGYEFVEGTQPIGDTVVGDASPLDSRISKPVGGGITGYLMRIKKEWYDQDQAAKAAKVKETEQAIKPALNQYVPGGGNQAVTDT